LPASPATVELVRAPLVTNKVVAGVESWAATWSRICSTTSIATGCRCTGSGSGWRGSVSSSRSRRWLTRSSGRPSCLRPLWRAASGVVLGAAVMQLDGTGLAVREPAKRNKKKLGSPLGLRRRRDRALPLHVDGQAPRATPWRARPRRDAGASVRLHGCRCVAAVR
jgi:hypothetical protein